ncbi:hypothetical protein A3K29_03140 [Candidatus Collierbacteria bacterium RIFOXYB2_FULL_46_14]|uniref:Glycosyltransferase 2-like domain-containing protein n=1 Tax=Candidatus Collierbacteria bacterium GW2011_GWA2_46_26 TaxID=1618381 RepID=A0A0G1SKI9_9BACT|nr:MAG: hypothetical protein UW29_C0004G0134 [Candidatus Collierbacteria bacterium GW2011_GWC2_44_13]KKU33815.1 MAG: hypothetical protein UX47_C0001G0098 [Candidatus Collierbacteria bacterium GW2011_GWA2_46_26]OGD73115.1 MAG: hypothetical protein A3K29_03140 [Candidatus Collierbacteria bacterium RIFOXYB2_FULL_46_14]OGD76157.1 MAG: hypothetical protein A3K43_03140 [Candidatus Collierbacteria bacterium RIFOXYA2_FULL_46_20]OGD77493.1 MAG: hypothetical protein A3K39_03140 [Candidatus Collierbacteri
MPAKLSVVIPTYNEHLNIANCLESLLKQSKKAEEIIVVDDGSTDTTTKIVTQYPVRLLKSEHKGPGVSRNLGASKANGDILVFVDADMTFDKNFLKYLTRPIASGKSKGVFNAKEFVSNFENPLARCWNINNGLAGKRRMNLRSQEDTEDFRAILNSEFTKVGGFDNTGYTDSRTLVKKLGYRPQIEKRAVSYHANPETYTEVFHQARWIGKRNTKFGLFGKLCNILRYSLPISLVTGFIKSVRHQCLEFIPFKVVYDFGYLIGMISSIIGSDLNK